METLYIADGHHRSAAAARVKEEMKKNNSGHTGQEDYNFFLSVAFPHSEMTILDYNRIIKGINSRLDKLNAEEISVKDELLKTRAALEKELFNESIRN